MARRRLLTVPVFRYSQPERGIVDGALFAFVRSTNPELLIVIEAQVVEGKERWIYSPARSRDGNVSCALMIASFGRTGS